MADDTSTKEPGPGRLYTPLHRYSHFSASLANRLYLWGGMIKKSGSTKVVITDPEETIKEIEVFDCQFEKWTKLSTQGSRSLWLVSGASTAHDHYLYAYGGYSYKGNRYHGCLHQFDVDTFTWIELSVAASDGGCDQPMEKAGAGMVYYDGKLVVFGGRSNSSRNMIQSGSQYVEGSTNELHVFDLKKGAWFSPTVTGTRPDPVHDFSLDLIDDHRAVLFGGNETNIDELNDVYLLELDNMHWTQLSVNEPCPAPVCEHAATCLGYGGPSPQLLMLGGQNYMAIYGDVWMFNLETKSWKQVFLPEGYTLRRASHSAAAWRSHRGGTKVVVCGGNVDPAFDTCATTIILLLGVQCLQDLCREVITRAIVEQPCGPDGLKERLPDYVPTSIRGSIVHSVQTALSYTTNRIDLSHVDL